MSLFAAVEAGGTKFVCAVGTGPRDIQARTTIETRGPTDTLADCAAFFKDCRRRFGPVAGTGIAAFGPLDLSPASPTYGALFNTPKKGWSGTNFIQFFKQVNGAPVALDSDVSAAVLAEVKLGAASGCDSTVYVTIGTGIGAGLYVRGAPLHGLMHPEFGHVSVPRAPGDERFESVCPYHSDCLEGLASGPAIAARWGAPAQELPADHEAWRLEAHYLAHMCAALLYTVSPERIVLGGGVMSKPGLIETIRAQFDDIVGGFLPVAERAGGLDRYIVPQALGGVSGLAGAFLLAEGAA